MSGFKAGDFVIHRSSHKGIGFVVEDEVEDDDHSVRVWHLLSESNPRLDDCRNLTLMDREPTERELAAFVQWSLSQ